MTCLTSVRSLLVSSWSLICFFGAAPLNAQSPTVEVLSFKGEAEYSGVNVPVEIFVDDAGRFRAAWGGWVNQVTGYDGNKVWRTDKGAGPYAISFLEAELMQLMHWVLLEDWQSRDFVNASGEDGKVVTTKDGLAKFQHADSDGSGIQLTSSNLPMPVSFRTEGVLQENGERVPAKVQLLSDFPITSYTIDSIRSRELPEDWFEQPTPEFPQTTFNADAEASLNVHRAKTGHLFVKPTIMGKEVGWFLFDTGATRSMIRTDIADQFDFPELAKGKTSGVGGQVRHSAVRAVSEFKLGPMAIEELQFVEWPEEGSMASKILGERAAGVLGWDIVLRSVVEVDPQQGKVSLYPPGHLDGTDKFTAKLFLHWQVPYVAASFEGGKRGVFMIDTGAGASGPIFHSSAVARRQLLEGRETTQSVAHGAGGEVEVRIGKLDSFEIAGHVTRNLDAVFMVGEDGESDLYTDGFLGGAAIQPFKIVLDYCGGRVAFLRRESP